MNRFLLITKVQLLNVFKQSNRKKSFLNLGSYTLGALIMCGLGIYYSATLFSSMPPELYSSVPYFTAYVVSFLVFIMGISTSRGMLFGFKDLDLLKAMPFTEKEIVFSKIAVFTLTEYAYAGSFYLPVIVYFGIKAGMSWLYYILALVGFTALPFIPIVLSSFIGMGLEKVSAGRKHGDLIKNILGVVVFFAIYGFSMYTSFSNSSGSMAGFVSLNTYFEKFLFAAKWYMDGCIQNNVLLVLASMALSVAVYVLFLYFYSGTVMKINAKANQGYHVENFKVKTVKENTVFKALFLKEKDRFFKNFLYVFNTAFGMILLAAGSIYLVFNRNMIIEGMRAVLSSDNNLYTMLSQVIILAIIFFGQMTCTTSSSVSLEGKSLWIIKSLPVTVRQIFWSKILLNVVIILVPSVISLLMFGIAFGFGPLYYLTGLLFITASALGVSMFGLMMNLLFPKLEYENEQEVIKQSMAAFLGVMVPMFAGMGILGFFFAMGEENVYLFYIILLIYLVLDGILYLLLQKTGVKKYNALI